MGNVSVLSFYILRFRNVFDVFYKFLTLMRINMTSGHLILNVSLYNF